MSTPSTPEQAVERLRSVYAKMPSQDQDSLREILRRNGLGDRPLRILIGETRHEIRQH